MCQGPTPPTASDQALGKLTSVGDELVRGHKAQLKQSEGSHTALLPTCLSLPRPLQLWTLV